MADMQKKTNSMMGLLPINYSHDIRDDIMTYNVLSMLL